MHLSPLAAIPPVVQGGMELVIGVYREVAPTHIIKKANGKYDEGIAVLDENREYMTQEQLEQIFLMSQRVEAARPPMPSGSTKLLDLLRNPFNKVTIARKYKRLCKEYQRLVQRISQTARVEAIVKEALLALNDKNSAPPPHPGPMAETYRVNSVSTAEVLDVPQAVALEIGRAGGQRREMSAKFCDVKLSAGETTRVHLRFTASCIMTVDLGLIQVPSLTQREDGAAPAPAPSGESAQATVGVDNVPRLVSPQSGGLGRNPSVISLSGTATIFPRKKAEVDLHPDNSDIEAFAGKDVDAVNKTNVHGEDSDDRVTYALRFDSLEYHAEVDTTLTQN